MDNKTKVLIVSSGGQVSSQVLSALHEKFGNDLVVVSPEEAKEKGFLEKPESLRHKMEELLPHPI